MTQVGIADIGSERHVLYRFFDASDRLLYVGITANPGRRFGQHGSDKPWWAQVANIRMEVHPDRAAVLAAERVAITTERPHYNIAMAGGSAPEAQPVDEQPGEWPVQVGDVVALGLHDRRCPVGIIDAVSPWGPRLTEMSFMDGTFDQETITVPWSQIAEIRHARPKRTAELDGWGEERYVLNGGTVWHTVPLGDFQTEWVHGHERMLANREFWASWERS